MAYRNTRKMAPGQTVSGGGWSGQNESAENIRHQTKDHYSSEEDDVYMNRGTYRGVEWQERPVYDYPMPIRRGRR